MAELDKAVMAMHAPPAAVLGMIKPQLLFRLAEAAFDRPTTKGDPQQAAQTRPRFAGHAVGQEVFYFARPHVARHDQALSTAGKSVGRFAPAHGPFDFPDLWPLVGVFDSIALPGLLAEDGRVGRQIAHFA